MLSPNSKWLAYQSNKTGRSEIYVRPFPELGEGEIPVTTEGGRCPVWARGGSELYYWRDSGETAAIWAVKIESGPPSNWGPPTLAVKGPYVSISTDTPYDVWGDAFC